MADIDNIVYNIRYTGDTEKAKSFKQLAKQLALSLKNRAELSDIQTIYGYTGSKYAYAKGTLCTIGVPRLNVEVHCPPEGSIPPDKYNIYVCASGFNGVDNLSFNTSIFTKDKPTYPINVVSSGRLAPRGKRHWISGDQSRVVSVNGNTLYDGDNQITLPIPDIKGKVSAACSVWSEALRNTYGSRNLFYMVVYYNNDPDLVGFSVFKVDIDTNVATLAHHIPTISEMAYQRYGLFTRGNGDIVPDACCNVLSIHGFTSRRELVVSQISEDLHSDILSVITIEPNLYSLVDSVSNITYPRVTYTTSNSAVLSNSNSFYNCIVHGNRVDIQLLSILTYTNWVLISPGIYRLTGSNQWLIEGCNIINGAIQTPYSTITLPQSSFNITALGSITNTANIYEYMLMHSDVLRNRYTYKETTCTKASRTDPFILNQSLKVYQNGISTVLHTIPTNVSTSVTLPQLHGCANIIIPRRKYTASSGSLYININGAPNA